MYRSLLWLFFLAAVAGQTAAVADEDNADAAGEAPRVLVYGASGRIGSKIVEEGLLRGYAVTGVTRDPARLADYADRIEIVTSDILDRDATRELVSRFDTIVVSVGGTPRDPDPANYIAPRAAESLIEVLTPMGPDGPRLIFVGSVFTLIYADGKTALELGRVTDDNPNRAMFYGHQIALDAFRASDINWTVASPPNGLRLEGRTGKVRFGGDVLLRDADGAPAQISREDYAFGIFEEIENPRYRRTRFNVAR